MNPSRFCPVYPHSSNPSNTHELFCFHFSSTTSVRLYSSPASMFAPETNTHFKIKTRPRPGDHQAQRFPHHEGHDLPPIPTRERHYPCHFQPREQGNEAPHLPLRQDQQHPQQYPHPNDQELHHLPPQHGYPHQDDQKLHSDPHYHDESKEHIPNNQHQKHHPKYTHPDHHKQGRHQYPHHKPQGPRVPPPHKTGTLSWFLAICCTIFWLLIIVAGLIVLIIFLIYHPQTPQFQISTFTLNSLYLDNGNLLNADIRLLANFNNSNRKVTVDYSYLTIDLYYGKTRISTQYIEPFFEPNSVTTFINIHMVTSQLHLPLRDIVRLAAQVQNNRLQFEIKGAFRTRSNLGSMMHYSYWLHSHCTAVVTSPPSGVLLRKKCRTKR